MTDLVQFMKVINFPSVITSYVKTSSFDLTSKIRKRVMTKGTKRVGVVHEKIFIILSKYHSYFDINC